MFKQALQLDASYSAAQVGATFEVLLSWKFVDCVANEVRHAERCLWCCNAMRVRSSSLCVQCRGLTPAVRKFLYTLRLSDVASTAVDLLPDNSECFQLA